MQKNIFYFISLHCKLYKLKLNGFRVGYNIFFSAVNLTNDVIVSLLINIYIIKVNNVGEWEGD
jgi:hypothetical protein